MSDKNNILYNPELSYNNTVSDYYYRFAHFWGAGVIVHVFWVPHTLSIRQNKKSDIKLNLCWKRKWKYPNVSEEMKCYPYDIWWMMSEVSRGGLLASVHHIYLSKSCQNNTNTCYTNTIWFPLTLLTIFESQSINQFHKTSQLMKQRVLRCVPCHSPYVFS